MYHWYLKEAVFFSFQNVHVVVASSVVKLVGHGTPPVRVGLVGDEHRSDDGFLIAHQREENVGILQEVVRIDEEDEVGRYGSRVVQRLLAQTHQEGHALPRPSAPSFALVAIASVVEEHVASVVEEDDVVEPLAQDAGGVVHVVVAADEEADVLLGVVEAVDEGQEVGQSVRLVPHEEHEDDRGRDGRDGRDQGLARGFVVLRNRR
mmetsp:Transcript_6273/g.13907  ORF Transcript_6273/g.13907 Transcript_6273/m.13907 type:complete len:206 (+) Transcript_6273:1160-1777(+)